MKNKFYRIISPVTFLVVLVLDISVIAYAVFAVKKLLENLSVYSVIFAIIDLFAIGVGAVVSKYVISQGIVFNETSFEFTALDENNIFNYPDWDVEALDQLLEENDTYIITKMHF